MTDEPGKHDDQTQPLKPKGQPTRLLHYEIVSRIGAGGMGEMWLARDTRLERLVALKTISSEHAANSEFRSRLISEARAAARLNHPNICNVHAIEEDGSSLFIVMEYVEGKTLRDLKAEGEMGLEQLYDIAKQCCRGLAAAHEEKVIHRDIKSANIMLDRRGTVKILDFGLARIAEEESRTGTSQVMGTFQYMSPEQVSNKDLDARTDIFSLGVVLYELTTGQMPFGGDNLAAIAYGIVNNSPTPLRELRPSMPRQWEAIVTRALQKDPQRRYQSAGDMLDHLGDSTAAATLAAAAEPLAIAVFSLRNIGRDPESDYLAEGLCEDLIAKLTKVNNLSVASRTAATRAQDPEMSPKEVAESLNANHFLDGSIRRFDKQIRISVQVVRTADEVVIWSETFDRTLSDVFALQAEVAEQVAAALNVHLSREETRTIERPPTASPKAYDQYLQGRYHLKRRDRESVQKAIGHLREALSIDPDLASANADLAVAYSLYAFYGFDPTGNLPQEALRLASLAVDQDPGSSDAHMALFFVLRGHDIKRGIAELRTAVALDQNNAQAHHYLAHAYVQFGLYSRAVEHERKAIQLDPFQVISKVHLHRVLFMLGDTEAADRELTRIAESGVGKHLIHITRGWSKWISSAWDEAAEELEPALKLQPNNTFAIDYLADCYRRLGLIDRAESMLREALEKNRERYLLTSRLGQVLSIQSTVDEAAYYFVLAREQLDRECAASINPKSSVYHYNEARFLALEDKPEEALQHLHEAVAQQYGNFMDFKLRPDWDPLRVLPEFSDLIGSLEESRKVISDNTGVVF